MFMGLSPVTALKAAFYEMLSNWNVFGSYNRQGALLTKPM